ncbi:hypothetical protein PR048_025671 [Dryococelus australis]|uniref:G-patch domain-containing protein n=1 Tax=Dryococelus australis TaxID=614101 RepID=A0ABQ9GJ60_9NEOP|nr:hypothetical protein PR048_025671 [Dryococelus australis]
MELHPNWNALSTVDFKWKQFVREGCKESQVRTSKAIDSEPVVELTGEQARAAYEEVVELPVINILSDADKYKSPPFIQGELKIPARVEQTLPVKVLPRQLTDKQLWKSRVMKNAENNDVKGLQELLTTCKNVNFTDNFGWTPLMCAACAGSVEAVEFLIESGANTKIKDKRGNTCLSLASKNNRYAVVKAIESWVPKSLQVEKDRRTGTLSSEKFFCESCKRTFQDTSKEKHVTSTVHLFNSRPHLSCKTVYGIPESNKGYQILLKGGWDRERGLGPDGSGHKYPLKTVLKQDREGLGASKRRPKVTHFQSRDTAAVRVESQKKVNKRQREKQLCKEQQKERMFRREFSSL